MKHADAAVIQNCYRATVRIETENRTIWARIRPVEREGVRAVFAFMLHPLVAQAYERGEELAPNPYIALQAQLAEPDRDEKEKLVELFRQLDIYFLTPADVCEIRDIT